MCGPLYPSWQGYIISNTNVTVLYLASSPLHRPVCPIYDMTTSCCWDKFCNKQKHVYCSCQKTMSSRETQQDGTTPYIPRSAWTTMHNLQLPLYRGWQELYRYTHTDDVCMIMYICLGEKHVYAHNAVRFPQKCHSWRWVNMEGLKLCASTNNFCFCECMQSG